eukprot:6468251-Amphidinium_carterae.3
MAQRRDDESETQHASQNQNQSDESRRKSQVALYVLQKVGSPSEASKDELREPQKTLAVKLIDKAEASPEDIEQEIVMQQ